MADGLNVQPSVLPKKQKTPPPLRAGERLPKERSDVFLLTECNPSSLPYGKENELILHRPTEYGAILRETHVLNRMNPWPLPFFQWPV